MVTHLNYLSVGSKWHHKRPVMRGFTLIELVMTVAILGILISLGVPSLVDLVRDQRVKTVVGDLYSSIVYARSEAITRNANVVICTSGDWAKGWSVKTADCSGTALKQQDAITGVQITQLDGTAVGDVTFKRDGRLASALPGDVVVRSAENDLSLIHI